jgi:hypothetical protein
MGANAHYPLLLYMTPKTLDSSTYDKSLWALIKEYHEAALHDQ